MIFSLMTMNPIIENICATGACVDTVSSECETVTCLESPTSAESVFTNTEMIDIPDSTRKTYSEIVVEGVGTMAPRELVLNVDISHTSRGDLEINLFSPDGSRYRLKGRNEIDRFDNIVGSWTIDASRDLAEGTWRLEIVDHFYGNAGRLNSWSLEF